MSMDGWTLLGQPGSEGAGPLPLIKMCVAANADRRLEVFALDANGLMHHIWELSPDQWSEWAILDGPGRQGESDFDLSAEPMVARRSDGTLQVAQVARRKPHVTIRIIGQSAPNNGWGNWIDLYPQSQTEGGVEEDVISDASRPFVVAQGQDGRLQTLFRSVYQATILLAEEPGNPPKSPPAVLSSLAAANDLDGRIEVFGLDDGGHVWRVGQVRPNGNWGSWAQLAAPVGLSGVPGVGRNQDGRLELFGLGSDGAIWHVAQREPNGDWGDWASLGGGPFLSSPLASIDPSDRLYLFAIGGDFAVWTTHQDGPNGSFGEWTSLGSDRSDEIVSLIPYPTLRTPVPGGDDDLPRLRLFAISRGQLWVRPIPEHRLPPLRLRP